MLKVQMNKKLLVGIAGAAIVLIGGAAVVASGSGGNKSGKYEYETVAVDKGRVARVISASGAVQPRNKVDVGSEVSGRITQLFVDFNSSVKKGEVLAQIDPETFITTVNSSRAALLQSQASVANAKSAIARAEANLTKAQQDYDRQKKLFDQGAISQSAWEQADQAYTIGKISLDTEKASYQSAVAGLARSEATLQDAQVRLEKTKIRSPIDGVVLARAVEVGQTVQSSMNVAKFFTIAEDLSLIQIEAAVVESDIGGIDDGDPASFTVDAFPGERFQGQVVQVRQQGAEQANVVTYTVVIHARNPNGKLKPSMTANVEITADQANDVLRIAYDATRFQPPKEVLEELGIQSGPNGQRGPGGQGGQQMAMGGGGQQVMFQGGQGGGQGGQGGGQRGPGGGGRGGFGGGPGGQNPMAEWLKEAGVDDARSQKIMTEMQTEMERLRASMPQPQGGAGAPGGGGVVIIGGGGFGGPPPSVMMQQQMQEFRAKMDATRETVLKRNLNETEYAAVEKHRIEMQSQKRVTVWKLDAKGKLERHQLNVGISDGNYAQIMRGAEEGDKFVVRSTAAGKGAKKPS